MTGLNIRPALLAGALLGISLAGVAEAATVRRHVTCVSSPFPLINPVTQSQSAGHFALTNNWQFVIPSGTVFTVVYKNRQFSFATPLELRPGNRLSWGNANVTDASVCVATFPDPGYGTKSDPSILDKAPQGSLQRSDLI